MSNHFTNVSIENFKSIKKIDFECKRINLFLGEPNVGKSNILEALALFSAPYSFGNSKPHLNGQQYFAWDQIRYESLKSLFFFQNASEPINVETNKGAAQLQLTNSSSEIFSFIIGASKQKINNLFELNLTNLLGQKNDYFNQSIPNKISNYIIELSKDGRYLYTNETFDHLNKYISAVKKYVFNATLFREEVVHNKFEKFLFPSYGSNVFTILNNNYEIADIVGGFFEKYDLEFIYINEGDKYVIQRKKGRVANQLPYDSIADTLQRIIFHLAAIYSSKDSVLLFEEPEAHTSPSYISKIADEVIKSKTNQFFITSHNPYFVENIIEKTPAEEVAVFVCSYKEHKTQIRELSINELSNLKKYKYDLVYNIADFEE